MNAMYGNYDLGFLTPDEKEPTDNKRKYVDIMNHKIESFIDDQKYKNTKRKTKSDCKQFTDWLLGERQREEPELINIPADEMNNYLCVFIIGICKKMATIMIQIHWLFFFSCPLIDISSMETMD